MEQKSSLPVENTSLTTKKIAINFKQGFDTDQPFPVLCSEMLVTKRQGNVNKHLFE